MGDVVTIFMCGDVMTGRGVDQILPHPGDPELREPHVSDARTYVRMAERVSGQIPQPVGFGWPWGDALQVLDSFAPGARVINLETSITRCGDFAPDKIIHYRMNPPNVGCVAAARPDACALANNHVLDFGRQGLEDTLAALSGAGLRAVGAGTGAAQARAPAVIGGRDRGRVIVFSCCTRSSGVPPEWAATADRPGLEFLPGLSSRAADCLTGRIQQVKQPRDVVVVSIHWGSNWGYGVPQAQVRFAHRLIDGGADVIHGHSSHHPRPLEVYRGKIVLYGCGDCIDDYEGISGYEEYRDDLRLLYFATVDPGSGTLTGLRMVPMKAGKMRLRHAPAADAQWLAALLPRISRRFGTRVEAGQDGVLALRPPP
jgi:poly-gamma-glutamate capsule biosynthesis protein CapA/YwtB (metallophosphatase superfamily)